MDRWLDFGPQENTKQNSRERVRLPQKCAVCRHGCVWGQCVCVSQVERFNKVVLKISKYFHRVVV